VETVTAVSSWPAGPGEMAQRIRTHDWAATPLGPSARWPGSLRALVDMLLPNGFPMVALWGPDLLQLYNDGYREIMGLKHPAGLGQPTRECWPEVWHINAPLYARVLVGESALLEDALYPIVRHGRLEDARFTLSYSPLRDEAGAIAGVLITVLETTQRLRVEAAMRQSAERLQALVHATSKSLYRMSPDWSEMRELRGWGFLADTEAPNRSWMDTYILLEDRPRVMTQIEEAIRTRTPFELEHRVRQADGSIGWTLSRATPLLDAKGEVLEWIGLAADVTARKQAEQERERAEALAQVDRVRRVLVAEIQHRSRNLLAVVRALVTQTLHTSRSLGEAEKRIDSRLGALSRVHALLSRSEVPSVTVRELVEMELGAVASGADPRIALGGPDVTLPGHAVRTFSLALHELVTNAVKHGALGLKEQGRVSVSWEVREGTRLFLEWVETGNAASATRPPGPGGFGRELIEQALPYELDARTQLDIGRAGVRCTIELPLEGRRS
jgi:PAS domain S-box-containing protein